jgi:hypothetical protein
MSEYSGDKGFLGIGWGFPPTFNRHEKDVGMVSEEADIQEALRILLFTVPGERIFHPAYGCGLKLMVFEQVTESAVTEIRDVIERAVLFFEPRITLNTVEVDAEDVYEGQLKIRLHYTIRTTNNRSNMVFPFYYQEGTRLRL